MTKPARQRHEFGTHEMVVVGCATVVAGRAVVTVAGVVVVATMVVGTTVGTKHTHTEQPSASCIHCALLDSLQVHCSGLGAHLAAVVAGGAADTTVAAIVGELVGDRVQ